MGYKGVSIVVKLYHNDISQWPDQPLLLCSDSFYISLLQCRELSSFDNGLPGASWLDKAADKQNISGSMPTCGLADCGDELRSLKTSCLSNSSIEFLMRRVRLWGMHLEILWKIPKWKLRAERRMDSFRGISYNHVITFSCGALNVLLDPRHRLLKSF